jgi:AraC-like DNA-binding protein
MPRRFQVILEFLCRVLVDGSRSIMTRRNAPFRIVPRIFISIGGHGCRYMARSPSATSPLQAMLGAGATGSPNSLATARRLLPSTKTARRTRAYSSTVYIPPVSHGKQTASRATNPVRYSLKEHVVRETRFWRWSTFTPPHHAANAASRGLFLLRRVQLQREIIYRLLQGTQGDRLRAVATLADKNYRTAKAVAWLRDNFEKTLNVDDLASMTGMSRSSLHHHFRSLTAMSPLQFQKQLRLHAARQKMLTDEFDAAPRPLQTLQRYYRMIRHLQVHRYFPFVGRTYRFSLSIT